MTYKEFIQNILDTRGRFACGDMYYERHHIVPKCMGGGDKKENLIDLYAKEHYEAHRLLALENPDNDKLIYAWWMMSTVKSENTNERYEVSAEEYEEARKYLSSMMSKKMSGENNNFYGKHHSDEVKEQMKQSQKNRFENPENHPNYGKTTPEVTRIKISEANSNPSKETRKKMSDSAKMRCTDEWRKSHSERLKGRFTGENNPNYGKHNYDGENNPNYGNGKCVVQLSKNGDYIDEYISSWDAHKKTGIDNSQILNCCHHKPRYKTAGGFTWIFKDEYEELIKDRKVKKENNINELCI